MRLLLLALKLAQTPRRPSSALLIIGMALPLPRFSQMALDEVTTTYASA